MQKALFQILIIAFTSAVYAQSEGKMEMKESNFKVDLDFRSQVKNKNAKDNYLGTEIDFVYKRKIVKDVMIIGGYSQMFASENMSVLKGVNNGHENTNNWAWVMLKVSPTLFSYSK